MRLRLDPHEQVDDVLEFDVVDVRSMRAGQQK
jgi:hypothetical protein